MDQSAIARAQKEQQKLARLIDLLLDWADWMRRDAGVEGYASHSSVLSGAGLKLFDDMCRQVDTFNCRTINACIEDLPPKLNTAIHHHYLPSKFLVPPEFLDRAKTLQEAHELLIIKVQKRGIDLD